ncbi:thiamine diphosphokinase [Marininema halotolerans]|uniref:Thiamine diphosphokinase n=1 Tax=Marininema halotolerans TaxID=1155944 RepID=A0A1I6QFJ3_9BACL|nr:thiamine diphosphokinase [Marininema halotolerans]SFS51214.1 thiamine pyrophosphokinase [Marininema halotolerans]
MNKRVVIVVGGKLDPGDLAKIQHEDWVIGVDAGVLPLLETKMPIHLAVGDFDTAGQHVVQHLYEKGVPVKRLPAAKDVTDTYYAVEQALERNPNEIILLGALGGARMDHAFANLVLLEKIEAAGVEGVVSNRDNKIRLLTAEKGEIILHKDRRYRYISLLALTDQVDGVTIRGFAFPLSNAKLTRMDSVGISNEQREEKASIRIQSGKLLIIESRDG